MALTFRKLSNGRVRVVDSVESSTVSIDPSAKLEKKGTRLYIYDPHDPDYQISFSYADLAGLEDSNGDAIAAADLDATYTQLETLFFFVS